MFKSKRHVSVTKPKIYRQSPVKQEHALRKQVYNAETKENKTVICDCKNCTAYLTLIKQLNPSKWAELTAIEDKFFKKNSLPEHVHRRRLRAYSIGTWRG